MSHEKHRYGNEPQRAPRHEVASRRVGRKGRKEEKDIEILQMI
ncbi:hypothetical protein [Aulosira sp. FACHB-615]|nr:hypothetical protein [Aulosira sp. FACHB-615]